MTEGRMRMRLESNIFGYLRNTNDFKYTWHIERSKLSKLVTNLKSPLIELYNRGDRYEFQLKLHKGEFPDNSADLHINVETIFCPNDDGQTKAETKAVIGLCILKFKGTEHDPREHVASIAKGKACFSYNTRYNYNESFPDDDLIVQLKITFCNGVLPKFDNTVKSTATTLSERSILDGYEELLNSAKFSDFTLVVGDKKFPAHKVILALRSPIFSAMFEHEMLENKENIANITDVQPEIMAEVLRFIYAGKVNNIEELSADLLAAADKYQLEPLRLMCEGELSRNLNTDNIADILKIVDHYESCRGLRDSVMEFLTVNRREVASLENFKKIFEALSHDLVLEVTQAVMMGS